MGELPEPARAVYGGGSVSQPRLLVVGHASRDLVLDDPRGWRLGGSVGYVSLTAARLGVPVRAVIGLDGVTATAPELELLERAGAEVAPVAIAQSPVFRNVETEHGRRQECLAVAPQLRTDDVPRAWRDAAVWAFVPVLEEIRGAEWARLPGSGAVVGVGWQGLLREVQAGGPTRPRAPRADRLLARADVTIASDDDLAASGREWAGRGVPFRLAPLFPREGQSLLLTRAERGGRLLVRSGSGWTTRAYRAARARVADATGAGDVFLGAFLATQIDPSLIGAATSVEARLRRRLRLAAVAAALAIEGPGLTTIPSRDDVLAHLAGSG